MTDAFLVRAFQRVEDLPCDAERLLHGKPGGSASAFAKATADKSRNPPYCFTYFFSAIPPVSDP